MKKLTSLVIILAVTSLLATTAFADPIHEAAIAGNLADLKRALDASADTNAKDENGATALHHAATKEVAELLIANSANKNAKDDSGETHLHHAAKYGRKEVVELLIAKGADVNAKRNNGQTPLHRAAGGGHKEVVKLLIDKGADVNSKIEAGQYTGTPLDWAESVSRRDSPEVKASKKGIADLLRKHGAKEGN